MYSCAPRKSHHAFGITTAFVALLAIFCLSFGSSAQAAGLIAPKSVCKDQDLRAGSAEARDSMLCMTNFARSRKGLKGYRHTGLLDTTADHKASDIIRCRSFSHEACGRGFDFWLRRYGYLRARCWLAGENIAWGGGDLGTVRSIFEAWMNSPDHRHAILSRSYTEIGIGEQRGRFDGYSGSSVWVQHFGSHSC